MSAGPEEADAACADAGLHTHAPAPVNIGPRMASYLDQERLQGLLEAARSLASQREFELVIERLLSTGRELTGAAYAAVVQRGPDAQVTAAGPEAALREALAGLPDAHGLGEGLLMGAVRRGDLPGHLRSLLGAPITIDGEPWGALLVADEQPDRFHDADTEVLEALAGWAAIAVRNARVYREIDQRRLDLEQSVAALEATLEIARAVGGETRAERVLELIADRTLALVGASGAVILLPSGPDFVVAATAGHVPVELVGSLVPGPTSVAQKVLRSGQPERVTVSELPSARRFALTALGLAPRAALVVPLVYRGHNMGVIEALDRAGGPQFRDEDERRLQAAAASAATAVATAQTVERDRLHRSLQAAEQERGRWARELHDETLQALGGLRMALSSARRGDEASVRAALDSAVDQLGRDIADLSALITELRPASLDQLGLEPALDALLARARNVHGLAVVSEVALHPDAHWRLDPDVETTVYRVVQEALTNAARHARATKVSVEVIERGEEIRVEVSDDGVGFDARAPAAGFGVPGMRERVTLVGGRLDLVSGPTGTTVTALLPAARDALGQAGRSVAVARAIAGEAGGDVQ